MRLSDAMVMGMVTVRMNAGNWATCAIGAAATAVGIGLEDRVERIRDEWPWLAANNDEHLIEIVTLFDQRVCNGEMTIEALIQHIRQIEPPCECGIFSCCCRRAENEIMLAEVATYEEVEYTR